MPPQPRVLVIDDDDIVRQAMCELLRKKGCEVFDVGSPIGVTRLIAANQIDVVVLDVMMPDISGDKLAKLLRSNPKLLQLSIVLVSAADIVKLTKLAKDVEADAVVPKANIHRELGNVVLETYRCKTVLGLSTRKRPV